ncbi:MAG TPA: AAA family ATPase [Atopostipes sp.]|nr:AAA family ATPase [Atopostipes sp.]
MSDKTIIVLVGPSGSGKTSIGKLLSKHGIPRLTTTTTRAPRPGEVDGVDYYFRQFSELEMEKFVEQTVYDGNRYGLTKDEVKEMLEKHDIVHVSLDQNGAEAMKEVFPKEAFVVFVQIDEEIMIHRMKKRGDSEEEIQDRIKYSRHTDELVPPPYTDLIVENIDMNIAAQKIIDKVTQTH